MNRTTHHPRQAHRFVRDRQGVALVSCLLLSMVVATFAVATQSAAVVELRIAQNVELRDRAFEAAEHGIRHALHAAPLAVTQTQGDPLRYPAPPAADETVPGDDRATFAYIVYFRGTRALPPEAGPPDLTEFHFVVAATGRASSGAADVHVQGFRVVRDPTWLGEDPPAPCDEGTCPSPDAARVRTYWRQDGAE